MIEGLLDPKAPGVVYDMREDALLLEQIREASLSDGPFGLLMDNGIVGSPEWWKAVEDGKVVTETFTGTILRVDGGPMGDSNSVRIWGEGKIRSWAAWETFTDDLIGKQVSVLYALVKAKPAARLKDDIRCILQVRVVP